MLFPVRCFSCGKPIGHLWEKFNLETKGRKENIKKALDDLGVSRYCCRQNFLGYVDLTDISSKLKKF